MTPEVVALLIVAFEDKMRDRNASRFIRNCSALVDEQKLVSIERLAFDLALKLAE
jgi:hypothetical protein